MLQPTLVQTAYPALVTNLDTIQQCSRRMPHFHSRRGLRGLGQQPRVRLWRLSKCLASFKTSTRCFGGRLAPLPSRISSAQSQWQRRIGTPVKHTSEMGGAMPYSLSVMNLFYLLDLSKVLMIHTGARRSRLQRPELVATTAKLFI
jgi:hypothetical protein